jgi:hypothetical protein
MIQIGVEALLASKPPALDWLGIRVAAALPAGAGPADDDGWRDVRNGR